MEETIFNYIDSILFNKKKLNKINENESGFSLYMVNRWCSMYSTDVCKIINETANKYAKSFVTKQEAYDFLFNILPKNKKKRIQYLKKNKEQKEEEGPDIKLMSDKMEISTREVNSYLEMLEEFSK